MTFSRIPAALDDIRARLNAVPYSLLILVARMATFSVFFRSGLVKLDDWNATLMLFQNEYKVPVLPAEWAAPLAASMELGLSSLVLIGLFTRLGAAGLLGMVAVIQLFVYPTAWPDHIQWLAFMIFIIFRGPGALSLDHLLWKQVEKRSYSATRARPAMTEIRV